MDISVRSGRAFSRASSFTSQRSLGVDGLWPEATGDGQDSTVHSSRDPTVRSARGGGMPRAHSSYKSLMLAQQQAAVEVLDAGAGVEPAEPRSCGDQLTSYCHKMAGGVDTPLRPPPAEELLASWVRSCRRPPAAARAASWLPAGRLLAGRRDAPAMAACLPPSRGLRPRPWACWWSVQRVQPGPSEPLPPGAAAAPPALHPLSHTHPHTLTHPPLPTSQHASPPPRLT
jgi:hypothetical protein